MTALPMLRRLGFFTRVLDEAGPAERYRLATEQIVHAEACGFDSAWVAQHHFHEGEGGLPAPLVFLAHVAARTTRIRLGTGIITLPLELPIRVAEDTAVLDMLSGGRLEVGIGPGGNMAAFRAFGLDSAERGTITAAHLVLLRDAWAGRALPGGDAMYPTHPGLDGRVWQASFGVEGARRAGLAGDGLLLSRTQPRPYDVHVGTPEDVVVSLRADATMLRATDLAVQVHSIDPPHPVVLRSIELVAQRVAPALGWAGGAMRRVA